MAQNDMSREELIAQMALVKKSELMLKEITAAVPVGLGVASKRVIEWTNDYLLSLVGRAGDEVIGKNARIFYASQEAYDEVGRLFYPELRAQGRAEIETLWKHKDGSTLNICLTGVLSNSDGTSAKLIFCAVDVTARAKAQADLIRGQRQLRELLNNMSSGVAIYEAGNDGDDFIFRDLNKAGERSSKISREDVIGKSVIEVFPSVQEIGLLDVFRQVWKTGVPRRHPMSLYRDERISQWVENYVYKLPSGEIVAVYDDITERKNAEELLRRGEEKLRSIMDNIGIGVAMISPDMEVMSLNRQMREWNPHVDLAKKNICYRVFKRPPGDAICSYCPTAKTLRDGLVHEDVTETPVDGQVFNYRIVSSPIKDADGKVVAAVEMVEDITGRRRLEGEARKHIHELEVFYQASTGREERILELKRKVAELEKKLKE